PCKSPDKTGNLLAYAASLKIHPIQWGGDGAYGLSLSSSSPVQRLAKTAQSFKSEAHHANPALQVPRQRLRSIPMPIPPKFIPL
ncbi:hypothetical protein, partial [Neorhizobium petrolearium]